MKDKRIDNVIWRHTEKSKWIDRKLWGRRKGGEISRQKYECDLPRNHRWAAWLSVTALHTWVLQGWQDRLERFSMLQAFYRDCTCGICAYNGIKRKIKWWNNSREVMKKWVRRESSCLDWIDVINNERRLFSNHLMGRNSSSLSRPITTAALVLICLWAIKYGTALDKSSLFAYCVQWRDEVNKIVILSKEDNQEEKGKEVKK